MRWRTTCLVSAPKALEISPARVSKAVPSAASSATTSSLKARSGVVALLLCGDLVDLGQLGGGLGLDSCVGVFFVIAEDRELDGRLGGASCQVCLCLAQCLDERLCSLKALGNNLFGRGGGALFLDEGPGVVGSFGFNHHDGNVVASDAAGYDHVEDGVFQLAVLREGNPLGTVSVVNQGNANATDRAGERQTGKLGRHRGCVDGNHVVELVRVDCQDGDNDLYFVAQALDECRAQRAVHQTASQDGFGRRAAFAAEEAARDAAGSVHALLDVHGQREEVEAFARVLAGGGCREQCGFFVDVNHGCTCSLLGQTAGFEADNSLAVSTVVDHGLCELNFWTLHVGAFLSIAPRAMQRTDVPCPDLVFDRDSRYMKNQSESHYRGPRSVAAGTCGGMVRGVIVCIGFPQYTDNHV